VLPVSTLKEKIFAVDVVGSILYIAAITCLVYCLQSGGNTKPWNSSIIIGLLCAFAVLLLAFIAWEYKRRSDVILPLPMLNDRSLTGAILASFFIGFVMYTDIYFIPLWYQVRGDSPLKSGIDLIPFLLSTVFMAGISGAIINKVGRYWHIVVLSPWLISVGSGLLFTLGPDSSSGRVIAYQIINGIGIGGALQNIYLAINVEHNTNERKLSQATSMINSAQLFGGLIGLAAAGALFANQLSRNIQNDIPSLPPSVAQQLRASVSEIQGLPASLRQEVVSAYIKSLDTVFLMGAPIGFLASVSGFFVRDYNVRGVATA